MKKEFLEFLNSKETEAPKEIFQKLQKTFEKDFLPLKPLNLILKFLLLNFSAGVFTLTVCPQFGLGIFNQGHDVTHYFMSIGTWACALFCATFYFATAQTLALLILTNREIRWIAQKRFTVLPSIVIASFIALAMLGQRFSTNSHMTYDIEFHVIWLLAGLIITQAMFNIITFKFKKLSRSALR